MTDYRADGIRVQGEMLPQFADGPLDDGGFAGELRSMSLDSVFGRLWARPALDRRSRSLVTLGILIALRATEEMEVHFALALRNGVSREELEEVVYQATAYAGFPAAVTARAAARTSLDAAAAR